MKFKPFLLAAALSVGPMLAHLSLADEIQFNNGDHLTGKILSTDGGKLTIDTTIAGEIKVDLKDVKTFTTDEPITLKMKDGNVINDKVAATTQPGFVDTKGTGVIAAQSIPIDKVDSVNPPPVRWTGSLVAGGLVTRGNSDTEQLNFQFDAVRRSEIDRITAGAGYLFGRQKDPSTGNESETTNNGFVSGKYDYFFTKKFYGYALAEAQRDRIADLDVRVTPGGGVGYQWVETPSFNFNTEAGLGYLYESYSTGGHDQYASGRLAYHVDKTLSEKLKLFNDLELLPSLEDVSQFNINESAGMRFMLTKTFFTELKQEWHYDSNPAPGALKNDLRYVLGVGWAF